MPRQAIWVHGSTAMLRFPGGKGDPTGGNHTPGHQMNGVFDREGHIEWSDILGLRRDTGATFRGRSNQRNNFTFAIPTPCWRSDGRPARRGRAALVMVGFTFTSETPVVIEGGRLFDGHRALPFSLPSMGLAGAHTELVPNVNRFDFPEIDVVFGLAVILDVFFAREGDITFHAVGADFEV